MEDNSEYLKLKPSRYAQEAINRQIYIPQKFRELPERKEQDITPQHNSDTDTANLDEVKPSTESVIKPLVDVDLTKEMYSPNDKRRLIIESNGSGDYRSEFRRDYARVLHSPSFRRLQGKTQLYPCIESDFFRNRLTHSLEVAQIARTIGIKLNEKLAESEKIDLDLLEMAGLAHDIGHPPFGHQGEEALNECMYLYGGFEGNAQTLRVLSRLEKKRHEGWLERNGFDDKNKDQRKGLNLTYRSLAAVLKYDRLIEIKHNGRIPEKIPKPQKGYYKSEAELVSLIKAVVTNGRDIGETKFKTIECCIMDIADDIAYSTFDLEDAFKAGFINPIDIINLNSSFHAELSKKVTYELKKTVSSETILFIISDLFKDILFDLKPIKAVKDLNEDEKQNAEKEFLFLGMQYAYSYADYIVKDGYVRSDFSSQLIDSAINSVIFEPNHDFLALSEISLDENAKIRVEILKQVAFQTQILSPKLKVAEFRGKEIVKKIFEALIKNPSLLPYDVRNIFYINDDDKEHQHRTVCDYIACMTDKYAIELYGRLTSENPETIFKPY